MAQFLLRRPIQDKTILHFIFWGFCKNYDIHIIKGILPNFSSLLVTVTFIAYKNMLPEILSGSHYNEPNICI